MNKTNDHHRYHPYHRTKNHKNRRFDADDTSDYKRHYKKSNSQYHSSYASPPSFRREDRSRKDYSSRHAYRNEYRSPHQQSRSKSYSCFSTPPPPLLSLPLLPPVPEPVLAAPLLTAVPHERESWVRSVKKTKNNESTEQKTQYLETMLRMPQQAKSTLNSTRFDRMRFANDPISTATATTAAANLVDGSFHLVDDIHDHDEIRTLEKIFFDNDLNESSKVIPKPESPVPPVEPTTTSGFLIDNCDEEDFPPLPSPLPAPPLPPTTTAEAPVDEKDVNERRVLLLNELDTAEAEQRQALKRQKRLHQKLKKKKKDAKPTAVEPEQQPTESEVIPTRKSVDGQESSSDWMIEYDIHALDPLSQLTDEVRNSSTGLTDEDRTAKVNLILMKIKKQQEELRKLRQYVMSMLGDQPKRTTTTSTATPLNSGTISQELLLALLNQSNQAGCWLCSGKMYSEVATQCDEPTTQ